MTTEAAWYDDRKTAIIITADAYSPTWEPMNHAIDIAFELAKSVPHNVAIIVDPHDLPMPKEGSALTSLRRLVGQAPANVTLIVGIMGRQGVFEKRIAEILVKISFRGKVRVVDSLGEAVKLVP